MSGFVARQSTLRSLETCGRRTWHDIQAGEDSVRGYTEATAALGTVVHAICAEILLTLKRADEQQMSTQEAVEVAYEVYEQMDVVLPVEERQDLIWIVLRFVERPWPIDRLMSVEERIMVPIVCQDGATRVLSCQPDAMFAAGRTIVVGDWKSGRGKPKEPKRPQEGAQAGKVVGRQYLTNMFQGDCYSLAALTRFPYAERVMFRELHLRSGQIREAVMGREELEHITRQVGIHLAKLERAMGDPESKVWAPRPGAHCNRQCPVARSCPVPAEQRGSGALEDDAAADAEAQRYMAVDGLRSQMRDALKARWDLTGRPMLVGDGTAIGWGGGKGSAFQHGPPETFGGPVIDPGLLGDVNERDPEVADAFRAAAAAKAGA